MCKYEYEVPKIVEKYLVHIRNKSSNTVSKYYNNLHLFFRYIKDKKKIKYSISEITIEDIKDITNKNIEKYIINCENNGNTPSTISGKIATLKSFFNYLQREKLTKDNPALEIEVPEIPKRLPQYLNVEECKLLLSVIDGENKDRDYCMLTIFIHCGLRLSELVGINLNSINGRILTVIGKGNVQRQVNLNNTVLKVIEDYLKIRPNIKNNALFLSDRKQRISTKTVQGIVKKYIIKAGLDPEKYSTHKLRHTAATLMYQSGNVDIRELQEILGHSQMSTTEIYTHLNNQQLQKAVDNHPLNNL